jgi:hypothetical protein
MAKALVNAHLVPSQSSRVCSELRSPELRGAQAPLGGFRFPLKPLLRSVNVVHKRGKKLHNGSIRSLADNGSSNTNSSNGSANSRMVPIEEALKGRTATFLSKRPEQPKPNITMNGNSVHSFSYGQFSFFLFCTNSSAQLGIISDTQ